MNKITLLILTLGFLYAGNSFCQEHANDSIMPVQKGPFPYLEIDKSEIGKQIRELNYESAKKLIQTQINQAKRKKQPTDALSQLLEECETGISALKGTNKIVFIDSVVVDKNNFLSAYRFDSELGKIALSEDKQMASFVTELGNMTYRTEADNENKLNIRSYFIEDGNLTNPSPLKGIELEGDINYPFLLADGTTFYFASRSGEGLGNYDIYVTRYDSEDGTYLQPTNLGFPFNSYANDYMMVIDESIGVGWFASDRYQPDGKVCVYTFINPKSRHTYDYELDNRNDIINAARIKSIKDTWNGNENTIRTVRQALTLKLNSETESTSNYEFTFVVNDNYTYHFLNDFKNAEARNKYIQLSQKQEELANAESTLSQLRDGSKSNTINNQILQLENQVHALYEEIRQLEKHVRQLELK